MFLYDCECFMTTQYMSVDLDNTTTESTHIICSL